MTHKKVNTGTATLPPIGGYREVQGCLAGQSNQHCGEPLKACESGRGLVWIHFGHAG